MTGPLARMSVDGLDARIEVVRVSGVERLHAPFSVEVLARAHSGEGAPAPIDAGALIGAGAEVAIARDDGSETVVRGVIEAIEARYGAALLTIVPRLAPLAEAIDQRVFLHENAIEIVREVLGEHRIDLDVRVARSIPARAQCVQMFESDLAFVSRLLAEEGVTWFVDHRAGVVVLADSAAAHEPIDADPVMTFAEDAGLVEHEGVYDVRLTRSAVSDGVRLSDYDFEHPQVDQRAEAKDAAGALVRAEVPGGYRDPAAGKALAALRLEEARARRLVLTGRTSCRRFSAGRTFVLAGAPRGELNRRWLLLEVRYEARDREAAEAGGRRFEAEFAAIPADTPHRPARPTPPRAAGVQTATVTGPAASEIHTNAHGQVTALLRWDRRRPADDTSSCWMRALQPATSGSMLLPRVGWEVLLGFSGTSADTPYVLGRLDDGAAPPAEPLPAQRVRSALGSRTTPGGGSANVFRTDDSAGGEDMLLHASRDYNERTESDKTVDVVADDRHSIGANRTQIVGDVHGVKVDAAQITTVGGSRSMDVGGSMVMRLGSESVAVGAARVFDVGGDSSTGVGGALTRIVGAAQLETAIEAHNRHVTGASTVLVGGDWNEVGGLMSAVGAGGAHLRAYAGPIHIRAPSVTFQASALTESFGAHAARAGAFAQVRFGGAGKVAIDGSATMKGSKVIVCAKSKLTLSAGGLTIELTPAAITVKGPFESGVATKVTGTDRTG